LSITSIFASTRSISYATPGQCGLAGKFLSLPPAWLVYGLPFPDINAEDPQAAVKVIWNMLWRPGTQDYVMPMVAWLRSQHGQLDRQLEFTSVSLEYARGDHFRQHSRSGRFLSCQERRNEVDRHRE
jgi:hypothetical protein